MIYVAIVEDMDDEAERLTDCLDQYSREQNRKFSYRRYRDAFDFLEEQEHKFDIIFMDVMLPGMTGMEAAERLRKYNAQSILIFVTNMVQFAIKSYEVDALDYIVKPISYERVVFKLRKALEIIESDTSRLISISDMSGNNVQISSDDLYYAEVRQHDLTYYTTKGTFSENKSLKSLEEELQGNNFSRCNACYLINLKFISRVEGLFITMANGDELKISQLKRKDFMSDLANYLGQRK